MGLKVAIIVFILLNMGLRSFYDHMIPEQMFDVFLAVPIIVATLEFLIISISYYFYQEYS